MKEATGKIFAETVDSLPEIKAKSAKKSGGGSKKKATRSKARSGSEKLTPAALYRKMIAFGKSYQVEKEQDFVEAARIYSEEAALIDQMRDKIAEDGLTVEKTYKTGSVEVAHPLLSELPRHVESANKCLRIPWTEEPGGLQSMGSQKSQTQLSLQHRFKPDRVSLIWTERSTLDT